MRRALLAALLLLVPACENPFDSGDEVRLEIVRVIVPQTASATGPITINLTVISGGCRSFDRLLADRTATNVTLEARGIDNSGLNRACTADVRFDELTHVEQGPFTDPFIVRVVQPGGVSSLPVRIQ